MNRKRSSFARNVWQENQRTDENHVTRPIITKQLEPQDMFDPFPQEVTAAFREVMLNAMTPANIISKNLFFIIVVSLFFKLCSIKSCASQNTQYLDANTLEFVLQFLKKYLFL